jgi:protein phosphatase 1K
LRKVVAELKTNQTVHGVHTSAPACKTVLSDPENKGQHQSGVNFDVLGSWNNRLSMDILMEESVKKGKLIPRIPLEEVGTASLIGRRKVSFK